MSSHGYEDFKAVVVDVAQKEFQITSFFETDAPECIEIFLDQCGEGEYLFQMINASGCNGNVFRKPAACGI